MKTVQLEKSSTLRLLLCNPWHHYARQLERSSGQNSNLPEPVKLDISGYWFASYIYIYTCTTFNQIS